MDAAHMTTNVTGTFLPAGAFTRSEGGVTSRSQERTDIVSAVIRVVGEATAFMP